MILFVYRDEVYNEDSPDKGIAEIIIGKQRNGPIGTVKLTFLGKHTRFENYSGGPPGLLTPVARCARSSATHLARRAAPQLRGRARRAAAALARARGGQGERATATASSASRARSPQADGFATLELEGAVRLRERGFDAPIAAAGRLLRGRRAAAPSPRTGLATAVHHDEQLRMLEAGCPAAPLDVWLKINTGMNRLGFPPARCAARARAPARAAGAARSITLMTHFANADGPRGRRRGDARASTRRRAGIDAAAQPRQLRGDLRASRHPTRTSCGSASCSTAPRRSPIAARPRSGCKPAMTLASRAHRGAGPRARRDASATAPRSRASAPMRIGVVACGYADGYPRHAPSGTPVLVGGARTRTVGPRLDGHDHRRPHAGAAARRRHAGGAVGRGHAGRRGGAGGGHRRLRASVRAWRRGCRWRTPPDGEGQDRLHLHRVRRPVAQVAGPVPALQRVEHARGNGGGGRRQPGANRFARIAGARQGGGAGRGRGARLPAAADAASASSTACSAAGWSRAAWC